MSFLCPVTFILPMTKKFLVTPALLPVFQTLPLKLSSRRFCTRATYHIKNQTVCLSPESYRCCIKFHSTNRNYDASFVEPTRWQSILLVTDPTPASHCFDPDLAVLTDYFFVICWSESEFWMQKSVCIICNSLFSNRWYAFWVTRKLIQLFVLTNNLLLKQIFWSDN